ncbi:MAG: hypothetical protein IPN21_18300 [Burkholderiales bacterium]|nr:hypothetical protein [Burkholderiales bacterium]
MNKFFEFSNGAKGALSFRDDGQPMFVLSDVPGLPGRAEYYATQWLDAAARQRGIKVAGGYDDDPIVDFPVSEVAAVAMWLRHHVTTGEFTTVFKPFDPRDVF